MRVGDHALPSEGTISPEHLEKSRLRLNDGDTICAEVGQFTEKISDSFGAVRTSCIGVSRDRKLVGQEREMRV